METSLRAHPLRRAALAGMLCVLLGGAPAAQARSGPPRVNTGVSQARSARSGPGAADQAAPEQKCEAAEEDRQRARALVALLCLLIPDSAVMTTTTTKNEE